MAKQAGIHGLRGKVNGMSYYYSKNGGELTRKINEGIGERVKTSAAYANTRKNNAEFGAAGAVAGAIMRTIPQKYRYILKSTATGLLNKEINKEMKLDTLGSWGQRQIPLNGQNRIMDFFNTLSKNQVPDSIISYIKSQMYFDSDENVVSNYTELEVDSLLAEELTSAGATHISVIFYGMQSDLPVFSAEQDEYALVSGGIEPLTQLSVFNKELEEGIVIIPQTSVNSGINLTNEDNTKISGLFVVVLPQRKVGTGYNTLQELCSAAWIGLQTGTVPEP